MPTAWVLGALVACTGVAPTTVDVPVGPRPLDLAAGDLDGDGSLDLVSVNADDNTLSVRLQRDGAWVAAPSDPFAVDVQPHMVALGDLDGDGDLDAVVTSHDADGARVLLGDGTGALTAAGGASTVFGTSHPHNHGLVVGDFDTDGDADVLVADQEASAAAVLLSNQGTLAVAAGSPFALGAEPYPPALGDLDGDGRLDVVVPRLTEDAIGVLLGDGAGGFQPAPGSPREVARVRPYGIALGDLDRDGHLDVVAVYDDTNRVSVLLGEGDGRLRDGPRPTEALGKRFWRPAIADVDGDGNPDLVGAGSGFLMVFPGDGHGGLRDPITRAPTSGWVAIAPDFDGDGRPDPAAPDAENNRIQIWPGG